MLFRSLSGVALVTLTSLAALIGCSHTADPSGADVPSFRDVSDAPAAIQTAARAVVRIHTAGEYATGSFISAAGTLLTNNHVLGVDVCPKEGCFAQITRMHQRHEAPQASETIFVVPQAVDVGLDVAVLQAYSLDSAGNKGDKLATPDFLEFDSQDASALEGTHVHVVGHPEGNLKKWTQGEVIDADGSWITLTAFTLPGSSGSPILGDDGRIVGILHRGPASQDLLTANGADTYSIGTASAPLSAALNAPLPPVVLSTNAPITEEELVAHHDVFLNAHARTAMIGNASKEIVDTLGAACDKGLARTDIGSPEDLSDALAACAAAEQWIDCHPTAAPGSFGVCPADGDAWRARYRGVFQKWEALNGELELGAIAFGVGGLALSEDEAQSAAQAEMTKALEDASPLFDIRIAYYLAAVGIPTYQGTYIADFVRQYKQQPHYEISATYIVEAALWLNHFALLDGQATLSLLNDLAGDSKVAIGAKLLIEEILYNSKVLD